MKMKQPLQYAKLPAFKYQTFEPQYQTFDPKTLKFSFYPVIDKPSQRLTPEINQDTKLSEAGNEPASDHAPVDGETSSPEDTSSPPEPAGMYLPLQGTVVY